MTKGIPVGTQDFSLIELRFCLRYGIVPVAPRPEIGFFRLRLSESRSLSAGSSQPGLVFLIESLASERVGEALMLIQRVAHREIAWL